MEDINLTNNYYLITDDGPINYSINLFGNMTNIQEDNHSVINGNLTVSVYPILEDDNITYTWQYYNNSTEQWVNLSSTTAYFSGTRDKVLLGSGSVTSMYTRDRLRCNVNINGQSYYSKEYSMPLNKKSNVEESESSIGEAIELITTKTFPVVTTAIMKNEMWLFGMGFFVLVFLGIFLHWLFRRGRR